MNAGQNAEARGAVEAVLRESAPRVLGVMVRRHGDFDACEDAVQEALIAAAQAWPASGVPDNPRGWLLAVASRKLVDQIRSDTARRRREAADATLDAAAQRVAPPADAGLDDVNAAEDDTLDLLVMCCHPALTPASQAALTLRAVGGLTTAEVARAHLTPEATMAQRISRAKQRIQAAGVTFPKPGDPDLSERVRVVLHVLYLIFNEGYTASSGAQLQRVELAAEAIRLTRMLWRLRPDDGEVAGLLALMLLTYARRDARTTPSGDLIPLDEQDRSRWDRDNVAEGAALLERTLPHAPLGPYQVQAAIAAVHAAAPRAQDVDWRQILLLYELLNVLAPSPMATLNRAVATAMVHGPAAGLAMLDSLRDDARVSEHHRVDAVRAHLLERSGDRAGARAAYQRAARRTTSLPEQRYLAARAARLKS